MGNVKNKVTKKNCLFPFSRADTLLDLFTANQKCMQTVKAFDCRIFFHFTSTIYWRNEIEIEISEVRYNMILFIHLYLYKENAMRIIYCVRTSNIRFDEKLAKQIKRNIQWKHSVSFSFDKKKMTGLPPKSNGWFNFGAYVCIDILSFTLTLLTVIIVFLFWLIHKTTAQKSYAHVHTNRRRKKNL